MKGKESSLFEIQEKQKRKRFYITLTLSGLVLFLIFGGGAWLIFRSSLFQVHGIEISGAKRISEEEIKRVVEKRVLGDSAVKKFFGVSHLMVWPDQMQGEGGEELPGLESFTIEKRSRDRVIFITVKERDPFGIWCLTLHDPPRCFWFDEQGILYEPAPLGEGNLLLAVSDSAQKDPGLSSRILPQEFLSNALSIFRVLQAFDFPIQTIRLEDLALQEMKVVTYGGPALYFSLRFPSDVTRSVIQTLRAGEAAWEKLEYIDFRVENRAYYK